MNILIEGINCENYYSKEHESFKTGLRTMYGAQVWGLGYDNYDERVDSFLEIKNRVFPNEKLDLIIIMGANNQGFSDGKINASYNVEKVEEGFFYSDLDKLECKKAVLLYDFWSEAEPKREKYFDFIKSNNIDYVFTLFRAPLYLWRKYDIYEKLIWLPPSFNPLIFNNWDLEKKYDVGNLNAGVYTPSSFYPERREMHNRLLKMQGIEYLYRPHPGGGFYEEANNLVGKNFSELINKCKIFVTSGNLEYKNFNAKYVEILASKACLFSTEILDVDMVGLIDGYNYIKVTSGNFEDKIYYYLKHIDELEQITERGYMLAMQKYNCYAQASYVYRNIKARGGK